MVIDLLRRYPGNLYRSPTQEMAYIATGNMGLVSIPTGISSLRPYLYAGKWIGKEGTVHETGDLVIPPNIVELGEHCFDDCGFNRIEFKGPIKKLPNHCFMSAYEMTEIVFPEGLEEIGDSCFESAMKLKLMKIPSTIKKIGKDFIKDSVIEEVWIPRSMKSIPGGVFQNAGHLKKLHIPEGIEVFEKDCFKSIGYESDNIIDIILPKSTKKIEEGAFSEIGSETHGIRVYLPSKCDVAPQAFNSNIKLFDCTAFSVTEDDPWFKNTFIARDCWGVYGVDKYFYFENFYFDTNTWDLCPYTESFKRTTWGSEAYGNSMGGG